MYDASLSSSVYFELDITGNVRRLRGGKALSASAPLASDLGGYRYTAFGHLNTTDTTTAYPSAAGQRYDQPLRWQSRWFIDSGSGLYDFRARVWSPELGAFLQPDEYVFLTPSGTLWSWPGQNPFRYRDPSGRFAGPLPAAAAAAGGGAAAAVGAGLAAAGIVGYAVWDIYHQIDDWQHPIVSHADPDKPGSGGKESCPDASDSSSGAQADTSGGGAKGPPVGGDANATEDADDPGPKGVDPNKLNHIFGDPEHNLSPLVNQFGSQEAAFNAVQGAAQQAAQAQQLAGVFTGTVEVGGQAVVVRGTVIEGVVRIGSFWIP